MKIMTLKVVNVVEDVRCDVCGDSTSREGEYLPQFGMLKADWGYGSRHDGEQYKWHLCEGCFFSALATLKQERQASRMFDENGENRSVSGNYGLAVAG